MNWRDSDTDLVHVVNYSDGSALEWSWQARESSGERWMCCGLVVKVSRDGLIVDDRRVVLAPWLHTQDVPTCLSCVVRATSQPRDDRDPIDLGDKT